jgi:DNA-directed RNA polymerase delta subunit
MRDLTAEEERQCRDHFDAIMELTTGMKLSSILETVQQQMNLSSEDEKGMLDVIYQAINTNLWSSFTQMGDQILQLANNPAAQAEMRAKMDALHTPKEGHEVEVPAE